MKMANEKIAATRIYPKELMNNVVPSAKAYAVKGVTPPMMTEEDNKLVYSYLRWLTLKRARDFGIIKLQSKMSEWAKGKKSKGISPADRLEAIKPGLSKATDWEFSGVVDLGSRNTAVKCIMGDTIRYAYYAYSPSFDVEIAFGRNCGSKFFNLALDKSADFIKQIESAVAQGREELRNTFLEGRYPTWLPSSHAACIFKCVQREPELALAFYNQCGRSAVELALNFLAQGWCLPQKLDTLICNGYYTVAMHYYQTEQTLEAKAFELFKQIQGIDSSINVQHGITYKDAPYVLSRNQITYPLNTADTLTALKAIVLEGLFAPTATAVRYDLRGILRKLNALQGLLDEVLKKSENRYTVSRVEVLLCGWYDKEPDSDGNKKQVLLPFKTVTELFAFALMTGDFYYLTLYLGLNPRYGVQYVEQDKNKVAYAQEAVDVKTAQDIVEEKEEASAERKAMQTRFQEAVGAAQKRKEQQLIAPEDAVTYRYVLRDLTKFNSVWTQKGAAAKANAFPCEWQYDVNVRAYMQAFVAQHIDEIALELKKYLGEKCGAPAAYSQLARKEAGKLLSGFAKYISYEDIANKLTGMTFMYSDCPLYVDESNATDEDDEEDEE